VKETVPVRKARIEAERLDEIGDEIEERVSERAAIQGEPQSNRFEQVSEDRYRLVLTALGITFEIDRLRRDHNELIGELAVRCALAGARTYDGNLSIADFNLSSARARADRAKLLAGRAQVEGLDWTGFLEELCQRVLAAERRGQPAVDLRDLKRPGPDDAIHIDGLTLPRRHPGMIYGDGGAAKSYMALHLLGHLAQQGMIVALFDWELAGEDHRDRLERLFGEAMPKILYARCERPLVYEADRLRRIVRESGVDYAVYDSVAFACDGPPESAEVAARYFRAVRQIGCGSLHVAHITKGDGAEEKPFGSVFWHNGARATYFARIAEAATERILDVALYPKKANLGRPGAPTGFEILFTDTRTIFKRTNPADNAELASGLSLRQRMTHLLRGGAMSIESVASELDAKQETVRRTVSRNTRSFVVLDGGKVGLAQRVT